MLHLTPSELWELSYRTTGILAESTDAQSAIRDLLALLGTTLDFDAGSFWVVHELRAVLRCACFWTGKNAQFPNLSW